MLCYLLTYLVTMALWLEPAQPLTSFWGCRVLNMQKWCIDLVQIDEPTYVQNKIQCWIIWTGTASIQVHWNIQIICKTNITIEKICSQPTYDIARSTGPAVKIDLQSPARPLLRCFPSGKRLQRPTQMIGYLSNKHDDVVNHSINTNNLMAGTYARTGPEWHNGYVRP